MERRGMGTATAAARLHRSPRRTGAFPVAVQHLWRAVFTSWFPSNPYEARPGPEISRVRVAEGGGTADAELWIPVRRF